MIHDIDRSGYFGASDTKFIMRSNHQTKSWREWWDTKLGATTGNVADNIYTRAGSLYEHPILDAIDDGIKKDGQIIIEDLLLRVNYDGWKDGVIYEVKTHSADKEFKVIKDYYWQCQVEMYVYQEMYKQWFLPPFKKLYVVSYGLYQNEYEDEPLVDPERIVFHEVKYDKAKVKGEYLPNLKPLVRALKKGKYPL